MLNMNTALILTILVGVISGFYLPNTKEGPGCKTAAKEEGRCVQVTNCDSLDQLFGQTMSKEKMSFLKNSGCGFTMRFLKYAALSTQTLLLTIAVKALMP